MQTAGYMAWFLPITFSSGFAAAAVESLLLKSGVPLLTIRKGAQALCATWRSAVTHSLCTATLVCRRHRHHHMPYGIWPARGRRRRKGVMLLCAE
jgi:hypothetical protein